MADLSFIWIILIPLLASPVAYLFGRFSYRITGINQVLIYQPGLHWLQHYWLIIRSILFHGQSDRAASNSIRTE